MGSIYLTRYGFREEPFRLTPDPKYFYSGGQYETVLSELRYGIEQKKGFMVLTGEVGTGKTTLSRALLDSLDPHTRTALILNPRLSADELLQTIVSDFGLRPPSLFPTKKEMVDTLNTFLLEVALEGGAALLIVDEAQNLSAELLEELRLLSNLETDREKLLQILLIGQPELTEKMLSKELRQLRQRISIWTNIETLDRKETGEYVLRRLQVAAQGSPAVEFTPDAIRSLHRHGGGYPRTTNILCDRVLMLAFFLETAAVTSGMVARAAREVVKSAPRPQHPRRARLATAMAAAMIVAMIPSGMGYLDRQDDINDPVPGKPAVLKGETQVRDVLSRYLTLQGYDYLGEEVRTWYVSGADLEDIRIALKYFDISRQYNLVAGLIPLDHTLWLQTGTMGIIPWDNNAGFTVLEAAPGAAEEWRIILDPDGVNTERISSAGMGSIPEALVVFRPISGFSAGIEKGSKGPAVYALQAALVDLGVLVEREADGIFGGRTRAALVKLQKRWDLEGTGILDEPSGYYISKLAYRDRG